MGESPSGAWAQALEPGSKTAVHFEDLLRQRIDRDYELDEALVSHILDQLRRLSNQRQLQEDLVEVFDSDGADSMASWCWDTLRSLTSQEPSEPGTPPAAPGSASPEAMPAEQQDVKQSKRAPICFNLSEEALPETAPKKASNHKAQQLGAQKHSTPEPSVQAAAAPSATATAAAAAADRPTRAGPGSSSGSAVAGARQRAAAPGASARMLHMTGLIRPSDGSAAGSSREGRSLLRRQQERREGDRPREHRREEEQHGRQQQQQQRKRSLDEDSSGEAGRGAAGSRRVSGAAAGPGSMFRSAMDTLKSERAVKSPAEEQSPPKPQQKQRAVASVFDRINKADLERLGVPQAQQHPQEQQRAQQPQGPRQDHHHQQQQGQLPGLPRSLQSRLGISGRPSPAAAAAPQHSGKQLEQPSPPAKPAAPSAVGIKRRASSTEVAPAAGADTASPAKPAARTAAPIGAAAQQQGQGQAPEAAPAKKSRTIAAAPAAAAAGSKGGNAAAELAALRAQLEARQAEVQRLKQVQESDQCSVVVFGVSPRVPDSVVVAHFSGCGSIKRCSLLPGRLVSPTAPGAYIEFQGSGAAAGSTKAAQQAATNALRLSGTMLLDQKITVTRKSDWKANQAKGQRAYSAVKGAAVQPSGPGHRSWKGPAAAGEGGSTSGLEVPPAAGVAEG